MIRMIAMLALLIGPVPAAAAQDVEPRVCVVSVEGTYGTLGIARDVVLGGGLSGIRFSWTGASGPLSFQTFWSGDTLGVPDTAFVDLSLVGISKRERGFAEMRIRRGDSRDGEVVGRVIGQAGATPKHVAHTIRWGELRAMASGGFLTVIASGERFRELSRATLPLAMFDEPARLVPAARMALDAQLRDPARNCRILEPEPDIVVT